MAPAFGRRQISSTSAVLGISVAGIRLVYTPESRFTKSAPEPTHCSKRHVPKPLQLPPGYSELLAGLKRSIRDAQLRAAFAVSRELILLYWSIGRQILDRQRSEGWGTKVIDRLAHDLQAEFPGVEGYSPRSLKYMRAFAEGWPDESIVQQVAAQLPWGHHMVLLDRVKDPAVRVWYLRASLEYGWSRSILVLQVKSGLHAREGKALTNFQRSLPPPTSDMAEQILKDPYNFDFLTVREQAHERRSNVDFSSISAIFS